MNLMTLLIGSKATTITRWLPTASKEVGLTLDATLKEVFKADSEPTNHPIENGSFITDHVVLKPRTLSIEGIVTETPMDISARVQGALSTVSAQIGAAMGGIPGIGTSGSSALGGVAGGLLGKQVGDYASKSVGGLLNQKDPASGIPRSGLDRLTATFDELNAAIQDMLPVKIQTGFKLYDGYILKSFTIDKQKNHSIKVALEFQEVSTAQSQTAPAVPKTKDALAKKNAGKKTPEVAKDQTALNGSFTYNAGKLLGVLH